MDGFRWERPWSRGWAFVEAGRLAVYVALGVALTAWSLQLALAGVVVYGIAVALRLRQFAPWRRVDGVEVTADAIVLRRPLGAPIVLPWGTLRAVRLRLGPPRRWLDGDLVDPPLRGTLPARYRERDDPELDLVGPDCTWRLVGVDACAIADALGVGDRPDDLDERPAWARAGWVALLDGIDAGTVRPDAIVGGAPLWRRPHPSLRRRLDPWAAASVIGAPEVAQAGNVALFGLALGWAYGSWWAGGTVLVALVAGWTVVRGAVERGLRALDVQMRHADLSGPARRAGIGTAYTIAMLILASAVLGAGWVGWSRVLVPRDVAAFLNAPPSDPVAFADGARRLFERWDGPLVGPIVVAAVHEVAWTPGAKHDALTGRVYEAAIARLGPGLIVTTTCTRLPVRPAVQLRCAEELVDPPRWQVVRFPWFQRWYGSRVLYELRRDAGDTAGAAAALRELAAIEPSSAVFFWLEDHPDVDLAGWIAVFPGSEAEARAVMQAACPTGRVLANNAVCP